MRDRRTRRRDRTALARKARCARTPADSVSPRSHVMPASMLRSNRAADIPTAVDAGRQGRSPRRTLTSSGSSSSDVAGSTGPKDVRRAASGSSRPVVRPLARPSSCGISRRRTARRRDPRGAVCRTQDGRLARGRGSPSPSSTGTHTGLNPMTMARSIARLPVTPSPMQDSEWLASRI